MSGSRTFWIIGAASFLAVLTGCNSTPAQKNPTIGTAYAGPATLRIHREIDSKSPTVATAHHGDKLDIVGQRRRWYKVRTAAGVEGWTSDRELLDTAQMRRLKALAKETAGMPSQGIATTFSDLNVHTEPSRQSPSFIQVKEREKVEVIAHKVVQRAAPPKRELVPPRPKPEKKAKKEKKGNVIQLLVPPAPEPPEDWRELSPAQEPPPVVEESEAPPVPIDDWTLIRTESGQSGWVVSGGLYLAIPDEVAQYAEGKRITSYFSLGKIQDGEEKKDIWLWTTAERLGEDHDFDGYRVFVWSLRHHRYETGYIQRRERGFFPVLAKAGEFSVCLENDDGSRVRKQYVLMGNLVHPAGQQPCEKTADLETETQAQPNAEAVGDKASKGSLLDRVKEKAKGLVGK